MKGINKAIVLGVTGADPEVKYLPSGSCVVNFTLATNEKWKDKQTGEMREKTEWHRIVAFGKLAEICGQYLKKGSKVYVEGKSRTRKYQAKDGSDRYSHEIEIYDMQLLDSKGQSEHPARPQQAPQQQTAQDDPFSDSIPFMRIQNEYLY